MINNLVNDRPKVNIKTGTDSINILLIVFIS